MQRMISVPSPVRIYHENDLLVAGKYKGKSVGWVMSNNPNYIVWLHENQVITLDAFVVEYAMKQEIANRYTRPSSRYSHAFLDDEELDDVYGFNCGSFGDND